MFEYINVFRNLQYLQRNIFFLFVHEKKRFNDRCIIEGGPVNTDHRSGWSRVKGWTVLWTRHNRRPATSGLGQAQMWPNTGAVTSPPRSVPAWSRTNGVLFVSRYDSEHPFSPENLLLPIGPRSENSRNPFEEFRAWTKRIEGIFKLNRGIS